MANISERGTLVQSLKGRDTGETLAIIQIDGEYALLANGKSRKVAKPKRKKLKHVKSIGLKIDLETMERNGGITDGDLKRVIEENLNKIGG